MAAQFGDGEPVARMQNECPDVVGEFDAAVKVGLDVVPEGVQRIHLGERDKGPPLATTNWAGSAALSG